MFAVIKSGGKQYKVALGTILKLEKVNIEKSNNIVFKEVLMVKDDTSYELGSPFLKNVEVKGKVLENKKDKKIIVFKKRRRHNSRRLNGHRQNISVIQISTISVDGKSINVDSNKKNQIAEKKNTNKNISKTNKSVKGIKDGT